MYIYGIQSDRMHSFHPKHSEWTEVWDFLKSAAEQRQADQEADQAHREKCFASLAQVVINKKLGKTSDVLNT